MDQNKPRSLYATARMIDLIFNFRREVRGFGLGKFLAKFESDNFNADHFISDNLDYFLQVCKNSNSYIVAIGVMVLLKKPMQYYREMLPYLDDHDFESLLIHLGKMQNRWYMIEPCDLNARRHIPFEDLLSVSSWTGKTNSYARRVTRWLLPRCSNPNVMFYMLVAFCIAADLELFEMVIAKDVLRLDRLVVKMKSTFFLPYITIPELNIVMLLGKMKRCENARPAMDVLCKAIEWGLAYRVRLRALLLMLQALCKVSSADKLNLLKFLYRSGMGIEPKVVAVQAHVLLGTSDPDQGGAECVQYLQRATRHVRRLKDLCIQAVSRCVGSRADRKDRISNLEIPHTLMEDLLFVSVIQDFLRGDKEADTRDPPIVQ